MDISNVKVKDKKKKALELMSKVGLDEVSKENKINKKEIYLVDFFFISIVFNILFTSLVICSFIS